MYLLFTQDLIHFSESSFQGSGQYWIICNYMSLSHISMQPLLLLQTYAPLLIELQSEHLSDEQTHY